MGFENHTVIIRIGIGINVYHILQDEGIPPLSDAVSVTVRVDPTPPVFQQFVYTASVDEFSGEVDSIIMHRSITTLSPPPPNFRNQFI